MNEGSTLSDLVAVDAVAPLIGRSVGRILDIAAGHGLGDDLGKFAHPVVLRGTADVKRFAMHQLARGGNHGGKGAGNIFNVGDGTPGRAIALKEDSLGGERPGGQVVEHQVKAQARGDAIGGGAAEESRGEAVIGHRGHDRARR